MKTLLFIGVGTAAVVAASSAAPEPGHAQPRNASAARAQRVFDEGVRVVARLRGDTHALPSSVARCAGCHERSGTSLSRPANGIAEAAPGLGAATLLQATSRRRGPPSRYDEDTFCRLLASGVDPGGVVVARSMPVYAIEPTDCHALWQWLVAPPS